ncbi:Spo0E family sporulation regulatory protein-aspartic acid phosphatase [Oceanobacillus sp. CF4.6]|uniref:Spo0E family sporulation regulatory protein-aspartic acid phosphatase n=1 Tax=Oceanobacillus sp. CF4.6 TaxID=3373080 RepID=UPI003EE760BD
MFAYNKETKVNLIEKINQKKETLLKTAEVYGISSENTIECSQELDKLIVEYQKITESKREGLT